MYKFITCTCIQSYKEYITKNVNFVRFYYIYINYINNMKDVTYFMQHDVYKIVDKLIRLDMNILYFRYLLTLTRIICDFA